MPVPGEFRGIKTLKNGMDFVYLPFEKRSRVLIVLNVRAGSVEDYLPLRQKQKSSAVPAIHVQWGKKKVTLSFVPGTSHFLEHFLFKGFFRRGRKRPWLWRQIMLHFRRMNRDDEEAIGAATDFLGVRYYMEVDSGRKSIERAIEFLANLTLRPLFLSTDPKIRAYIQRELEKERRVILTEWAMYEDDFLSKADEANVRRMFPNHPLGQAVVGDESDIKAMTLSRLSTCYGMYYMPSNMFAFVIGGGFAEWRMRRYFEKHFRTRSRRRKPIQVPPQYPKLPADEKLDKRIVFIEPVIRNIYVAMGFPFLLHPEQAEQNPDAWRKKKYALWLLRKIFAGRWSSQAFTSLREEQGIGYRHYGDLMQAINAGYLQYTTFLYPEKPDDLERLIRTMLRIMKRLATRLVDSNELEDAKLSWTEELRSNTQTPHAMAEFAYHFWRLENKQIPTIEDVIREINKITAEDLLAVAQEVIKPNSLYVTFVGNIPDAKTQKRLRAIIADWQRRWSLKK